MSGSLEPPSVQSTSERLGLERRADWFSRLTPEKQRAWLDGMSDRVRSQALPTIDEHVHPSHVVEAIREEPRYIQLLVIKHLRPILTVFVAEALGLGAAANPPALNARQPVPEIISVVRRTFMSHFVSAAELATPTALDLLSSAELARLVRLLGVCEIALACRSIPAKETVAAFLRRFSAEDARAIAAYISTLTNIEPQRVRLAEESVREALQTEDEPAAMLDRTGLHLLALRFAGHDETRLRYTAQKFPLEIALWLRMRAAEATSNLNAFSRDICPQQAREIVLRIGHETEALAEGVKRGTLQAGD